MRAADHTQAMLDWWAATGVDRVDLAVRRASGAMLWQRDGPIATVALAWARAENAQHADIYIRPARGSAWPLVFVDDVAIDHAQALTAAIDALLVDTSPAGGCHVWIRCDRALTEDQRQRAQRAWVARLDADPGSVSGEHLGRLAGFKNWKRGGCWVNVRAAAHGDRPWIVVDDWAAPPPPTAPRGRDGPRDTTPSGQDWAWVCTLLEHHHDPDVIYRRLVDRARPRRGADAERYAQRTVARARQHVARRPR
ncbi:MAG TPA: DNA-primase RepB domain-containing protein [Steroidobacteraceae bacterium]|nr:DNA-primase RepB domain-containing protein [Steroidobacteraceae bacterium]